MQVCGSSLYATLESNQRDLLEIGLFEFYPPDVTDLCPANAEKRFAPTAINWLGYNYERQVVNRDDVRRYITKDFNNTGVSLSNVDTTVGSWLDTTDLEGYRLVIRTISRSNDTDSIVLAVMRCEKPQSANNTLIQISSKQDLGSIENDLPWNKFTPKCPLKFKGPECLAGQLLTDKSAAYQAASVCNKSKRQCYDDYANGQAFQGEFFNPVTGNFKVSRRRGGAGGAILSLFGLGNKRVTAQYSSQEASSTGQAIPVGLGRTQLVLLPSQYADTGEYLAGQWIIGEGPIQEILNLRNISSGWADTFQALSTHPGEFGYNPDQDPEGFFASQLQFHSHRAYVEATIKGENPDTGDPAPDLAAIILWTKIPTWTGSQFFGEDWSDNPVEQLRYLLTEERSLKYNATWIDDGEAGKTIEFCNEPLKDETGAEDIYISTQSGTPGTDYKRYNSTGLLNKYYFRRILGLTGDLSASREATVNTFNPATPPTITVNTYYRKRYTSNFAIQEKIRVSDFIFQSLLPSFNGYLVTSAQGRLQIKAKRPALTSFIRGATIVGGTVVAIEDALAWRNLDLNAVFALVGAGLATSETARISTVDFSTAGNSITLSATGSGTASGANFAGGTSSIQAQATVTIGSASSATITIDGVPITYTSGADDTTGTIAAGLAVRINADPTLKRYVMAIWTEVNPTVILLRSKLGVLNLAVGLSFAHDLAEKCTHVHLPFSDKPMGALTRGNISQNGFQWPLGSRQSSYNQFKVTFNHAPDDFGVTELVENDDDHQEKVNKTNTFDINGACIDNYHQAARLVVGAKFEQRSGDNFIQVSTKDGRALLLEEGDIICANHSQRPAQRNLLCRIEELRTAANNRVTLVARLYADEYFPETADERTVPLTTGIGFPSAIPEAVTNIVLSVPSAGTLHVEFDFTPFLGTQAARIEVERDGEVTFSDTGLRVSPDGSNHGVFELSGLILGTVTVRITPYSTAGDGPLTDATYGGGYGQNYGSVYGG